MTKKDSAFETHVCAIVGCALASSWGLRFVARRKNKPDTGASRGRGAKRFGKTKSGESAGSLDGNWLIVEANNLDGWLYASVKDGYFPNQEWFDRTD